MNEASHKYADRIHASYAHRY